MINELIEFIRDYYLATTIISIILIFALIGYVVDHKKTKDIKIKKKKKSHNNQVDSPIDTI
ncbi:MAG: hypothetical protein E7164_04740 [Firmicutes bacterium]|nr:hypothetical protein [Bacillota bacterium]